MSFLWKNTICHNLPSAIGPVSHSGDLRVHKLLVKANLHSSSDEQMPSTEDSADDS
jgi:hypothetical protein